MRVLVTGSRTFTDSQAIYGALEEAYEKWLIARSGDEQFTVVHGGARGADTLAAQWGMTRGHRVRVEEHRANWELLGLRAGHVRNAVMISKGVDLCLAFPQGKAKGTRDCIAQAQAAGIPVQVHDA